MAQKCPDITTKILQKNTMYIIAMLQLKLLKINTFLKKESFKLHKPIQRGCTSLPPKNFLNHHQFDMVKTQRKRTLQRGSKTTIRKGKESKTERKKMYVGVHMTKKKLRGRVNRPHSNILQQFNYSILEEEEEKERKDQSE